MIFINRIKIITADISCESVDAIVNAANTDLILGCGVAGAIRINGGDTIQAECDAHGSVELGHVALTGGGELPAKFIIHAAVMHWGGGPTEDSIREATCNSLTIASDHKFGTISFPALGTGIGGFSMTQSAEIMINTTIDFLQNHTHPVTVRFVLYDNIAFSNFSSVWNDITGRQE